MGASASCLSGDHPPHVPAGAAGLEPLWEESAAFDRRLVIIGALQRSRRQLQVLGRGIVVRERAEQMRQAVQSRAALVIGSDDMPRRPWFEIESETTGLPPIPQTNLQHASASRGD